jgi:hypothetical protein
VKKLDPTQREKLTNSIESAKKAIDDHAIVHPDSVVRGKWQTDLTTMEEVLKELGKA